MTLRAHFCFTASGERGQSLVEFAFSLIILLILLTGIFDTARALFTYLSLRDAAQEGAVYAAIEADQALIEILNRVCEASNLVEDLCDGEDGVIGNDWTAAELADGVGIDIDVVFTDSPCMSTSGVPNRVEVTVRHNNFPLTMPLIGELVSANGSYEVPISTSIRDTVISPTCSP